MSSPSRCALCVASKIVAISALVALLFVVGCGSQPAAPTPAAFQAGVATTQGNFSNGETTSYNITVTNSGGTATSGAVTVTDPPTGFTITAMSGTGWTCTLSTLTCTRSDALAGGQSYPVILVTGTVTAANGGTVSIPISVSGGGVTTTFTATPTLNVIAAALSISKTHTGTFSQGQQNATYAVTVSDGSSAGATNGTTVTVTDTVPVGETLVSMAGTGWSCASGGNTCTRIDILANNSSYPVITVTVNVSNVAATPQVNMVQVSGGGAATASNTDSTVVLQPSLSITSSHIGIFAPGEQNAAYTLTVKNATGAAATSSQTVTVTETAPAGETLVSLSGTGWTCVLAVCTRNDPLAAGMSYPTITATVNVAANATSPQINAAQVSGGGSATANITDSTVIAAAVLSIAKSHTGSFSLGQQNAPYTVVVSNGTNAGPTVGIVTVTDTVPSGETLVSMSGTGWTCVAAICTRADGVATGGSYPSISVLVNVATTATSPQVNSVQVSGGGAATAASTTDSTVIAQPSLTITKTHQGNFADGEQNAQYTISVANGTNAGGTVGTVTVIDTVPTGETLVAMSGTGWTCVVATATCTRSDPLAGGMSYANITATVNVAANATSPQVNSAQVTGGGSSSSTSNDSTTILPPSLSITKSHTGTFILGGTGTYTVNVSNASGAGTTSGTVTVVDTIPTGETLISMSGGTGSNWVCITAICTRSDSLVGGQSYDSITVTVSVASNAQSPVTNMVQVSGGNSASNSASDPTSVGSADPCATAGSGSESLLNGQYVWVTSGFDAETTPEPAVVGGVLNFNGSGTINAVGTLDRNLNATQGAQSPTVTGGTYKVDTATHRACLDVNLNTSPATTVHYRASLGNISGGVAQTGHIIDFDAAGPFTTGTLRKQSATIPTTLSGAFAFGASAGQNTANCNNSVCGGKFGVAGVTNFFSNLTATGEFDVNTNGKLDNSSANTAWPASAGGNFTSGSYTINSSTGKGTLSFTPTGSTSPVDMIIYVVSPTDLLLLNSDDQTQNSLFAGEALAQGSFSSTSLNGNSVIYETSLNSGSPSTSKTQIGAVTGASNAFTGALWKNNGGTVTSMSAVGTTYTNPDSVGRVLLSSSGNSNSIVLYMVSSTNSGAGFKAFLLGDSGGVETGMFEPQTSTAAPSGMYAAGTINPQEPNSNQSENSVTFTTSSITGIGDDNNNGNPQAGGTFGPENVAVGSDGLGQISTTTSACVINTGSNPPTPCQTIFYTISSTRAVIMDLVNDQGSPQVNTTLTIADQ